MSSLEIAIAALIVAIILPPSVGFIWLSVCIDDLRQRVANLEQSTPPAEERE